MEPAQDVPELVGEQVRVARIAVCHDDLGKAGSTTEGGTSAVLLESGIDEEDLDDLRIWSAEGAPDEEDVRAGLESGVVDRKKGSCIQIEAAFPPDPPRGG